MKNNMKFCRVFLLVFIGFTFSAGAQLMNFSQYQMTPMLNNPSQIARGEELKIDFGYRNQFGGETGNYGTPLLSAYKPLYLLGKDDEYRKFGAAGIQFLNDRTGYNGMLSTSGFTATYAHVTNLTKADQLLFGLTAGVFQRRVDFGNLTSGNQWDSYKGSYDKSRPLNENISASERRIFPLVNAGITYLRYNAAGNPFVEVSVAANSLNTPNVSLNTLNAADPTVSSGATLRPLSLNFQASVAAFENQSILVKPTVRHIQERQQSQTNIGSYFYYKFGEHAGFLKNGNIGLGFWYSNNNAAISAIEINMPDWALGFSYDFLTSSLSEQSNRTGAPEIVIGFRKYVGKNKKVVPQPVVAVVEAEKKAEKPSEKPAEVQKPTEAQKQTEAPKQELAVQPEKKTESITEQPASETKPVNSDKEAIAQPKKEAPVSDQKGDANAAAKKNGVKGKEKNEAVAAEEAVKPAVSEKEMTPEELEKERARKRQVYMVPLGFRGKDPFGGSKVALTKQERAFLSKSVKFKKDGSDISGESADHLRKIAGVLRKHPNMKIEIRGFGCDLGSDEVNEKLSQSRADHVKDFLVKLKVPSRQLNAVGRGKLKPEDDIRVN